MGLIQTLLTNRPAAEGRLCGRHGLGGARDDAPHRALFCAWRQAAVLACTHAGACAQRGVQHGRVHILPVAQEPTAPT